MNTKTHHIAINYNTPTNHNKAKKHITPNSTITYRKVTLIAKTSVFTEQCNRCGKPSM